MRNTDNDPNEPIARERERRGLHIMAEGIHTPPMSKTCRRKVGNLLRELQDTGRVANADVKPMKSIVSGTYELRVQDENHWWRMIYHLAPKDVVILEVFAKTTAKTPENAIVNSRKRITLYYQIKKAEDELEDSGND